MLSTVRRVTRLLMLFSWSPLRVRTWIWAFMAVLALVVVEVSDRSGGDDALGIGGSEALFTSSGFKLGSVSESAGEFIVNAEEGEEKLSSSPLEVAALQLLRLSFRTSAISGW